MLQEQGESTSRHGRAAFSVLLFQVIIMILENGLGVVGEDNELNRKFRIWLFTQNLSTETLLAQADI